MTVKIDKIDEQIIANLQRYNAPKTANEMAGELGVSPATVRRRVKRLTNAGIVRVIVLVDPDKIGLSVVTVIGFHVEGKQLAEVVEDLKRRTAITWLASSIGNFDIMALARFSSIESLAGFVQTELSNIDGIKGTEVVLCLEELKNVRVTR
jgi:Lrp/AsnC family transcriptional regulator, regulator for asnA, asnC and gidA